MMLPITDVAAFPQASVIVKVTGIVAAEVIQSSGKSVKSFTTEI